MTFSSRKILNELADGPAITVSKIEEESNSSQTSQDDGEGNEAATNLSTNTVGKKTRLKCCVNFIIHSPCNSFIRLSSSFKYMKLHAICSRPLLNINVVRLKRFVHNNILFCEIAVIPAIQIAGSEVGTQGLQTLTMTNAGVGSTTVSPAGATIVQYAQSADGQFFIPGKLNCCYYYAGIGNKSTI